MNTSELSSQLVPLCDGRRGLRSTMPVEIREPSPLPSDGRGIKGEGSSSGPSTPDPEHSAILDFKSSDETLDRCDEIIVANGWKLESYQRNPVFQNAHQYGDVIFTLGRALITEVRYPRSPNSELRTPFLYQRIQFAVDVNPMAKVAYGLYRGKFLNAVSVGFIPLRWQDAPQASSSSSASASGSLSSAGGEGRGEEAVTLRTPHSALRTPIRRRYLEQELLEVSAVAIPANPNALALGLKSGAVEKADLTGLAELINQTLDKSRHPADAEPPISLRQEQPCPRLLTLARELHAVLKKA